jgi:hypothetical protein
MSAGAVGVHDRLHRASEQVDDGSTQTGSALMTTMAAAGTGGGWAVEARGLTKRFGSNVAVNNVDLRIPRGCAFGYRPEWCGQDHVDQGAAGTHACGFRLDGVAGLSGAGAP